MGCFIVFTTLVLASSLPYPDRISIKSIQPDNWANPQDFIGNQVGGIAQNLVWSIWEPNVKLPPCASNEVEYDGHCFIIDSGTDQQIIQYSKAGIWTTGVLYGVPEWARVQTDTKCNQPPGYEIFCKPDNPADYGRFVGMIAQKYNGTLGGRVIDFVIMNEVNANVWFNVGCGGGVPCDQNQWISDYAACYNAAYDAILAEQPDARVLASFEHSFDYVFDQPANPSMPLLSVKTFVTGLVSLVGARTLRLAYHPYASDLFSPDFSADDLPYVTYGNIGALPGWLIQKFPQLPKLWGELQCTESGVSSTSPQSDNTRQANSVCIGMKNIVSTPGITNYVYHHMVDNAAEGGLLLGLCDVNRNFKPSWSVWATCTNPSSLNCGFENLPYTRLTRGYNPSRGHWVTSRTLPPGFTPETSGWRLFLNSDVNGTKPLYECGVGQGGHNLISPSSGCENLIALGPVGWIYATQQPGTVALYRCTINNGQDHFVSTDPKCEGQTTEQLLGYAVNP